MTGGIVVLDRSNRFFKAPCGRKLLTDNVNRIPPKPTEIANYWRAKASGLKYNFDGDGNTSDGLCVVGSGKSGVAYQFVERLTGEQHMGIGCFDSYQRKIKK
ncbi:hypothetical protein EJ110_NYTH49109 [Nymphaea thermarum]|nr:hypothetical protein EJ110_NYTH49109 [Nymphaea thermarum]